MRIVATAPRPNVAPGCEWDLKTRAERTAAVRAAVDAALERLKPKEADLGIITTGNGTILDGHARALVCENHLRIHK